MADRLNAAFEKVAKAAERRLEAAAKKQEKRLEAVGQKLAGEARKAFEAALKFAVANVEALADELRLSNAKDRETLRRTLDATTGGIKGAKQAAELSSLLPPQYRIPIAIVGGLLGASGKGGFGAEDARKEAQKFAQEIEHGRLVLRRLLSETSRDADRLRAAQRRTGTVG